MSDSVKAWHEMQEELWSSMQADREMAAAGIGQENKKAYRILIDYKIEDIRKAVEIYEQNKLDE
jgi:hypothetical protein